MIYAATGEEGIGNGYLPRDASGHGCWEIKGRDQGKGSCVCAAMGK